VITDNVYDTDQTLVVTANACLVFQFGTCKGFFCALCETMETTSDFIANQLNTVEALCTSDGNNGAVVSDDPPEWDVGFVYSSEGLPTYDVC
jgi:hypothetical protein